jgi:hypothetical protein
MNETSEVAYARLRLAPADDNNTNNNHDKQLHATTGRSTLNTLSRDAKVGGPKMVRTMGSTSIYGIISGAVPAPHAEADRRT